MSHTTLDYEEIIRAAGYRVTNQRVVILDAVCQGQGHTSPGEIYARARKLDRSIDRSTVYRTLKLYVELGLVVAVDVGTGATYYEIAKTHPHHHLVCRKCGRQQEIGYHLFDQVFEQVAATYGFQVEIDHLVLFGLCQQCAGSVS